MVFCGSAVASVLRRVPQCERNACGRACGTAARRMILLLNQRVDTKWPILDTVGVGQYGPRGFEGGESPVFPTTSRVSTMSNDARRTETGATPPDEAALSARLKSLGQRLDQVGKPEFGRAAETGPASRPAADHAAFARGFRLSSELVAGVLVGAGIGWLIDRGLGTLPWGMFVFALLGFAAGVLNVMRSAGVASGGVPDSTVERRNDR